MRSADGTPLRAIALKQRLAPEKAWEGQARRKIMPWLASVAEVCSHSDAMNVVAVIDGIAMVEEIGSDGDAKLAMMVGAGVPGLADSVGS